MNINPSITANFFLKRGAQENRSITLMKLLKLVYIAHGWSLAMLDNDEGVLDGEKVEAWPHGPVIPSLYHEFKHFKNAPIQSWSQTTIDQTSNDFELKPLFLEKTEVQDKEKLLEIFDTVWEAYKEYSASGLRQITHEPDTPWEKIYKEGRGNLFIPNDLTQSYYKNYLQKLANDNG